MLKGIPEIISPELMKVLLEMGHGDEIVIADGNFPAASMARRLVRAGGHHIPYLLDAILMFFPLDTFVDHPVILMAVVEGDRTRPTIWEEYRKIIGNHEKQFNDFQWIERFDFYQRARDGYCVVATGEKELYANIILKKGVVR